MVCLLGQTIKITGGNILCHIPGLAFLVEIVFLVVSLIIFDCPPRLLVGEELRWRGGERVYSTWLSSRCPSIWHVLIQTWWPTTPYDQPNTMIIPIHHVQGGRRSAGTEMGPLRDDGRHRQHDRRVLIRADSFHQEEPGYNHCFVSKWYACFHCLTNAVTIEVSTRTSNVSSICSEIFEMRMEKALVILLSQWFCNTSHLEYRLKSSFFTI